MGAGVLYESVAFDAPSGTPDGYGGQETGWAEQYSCRAQFIYQRGGEDIQSARLQGDSVYKVKIRTCADARNITTDWRMRDIRRSVTYNVREVDAVTDRRWVWLIVQSGVAV